MTDSAARELVSQPHGRYEVLIMFATFSLSTTVDLASKGLPGINWRWAVACHPLVVSLCSTRPALHMQVKPGVTREWATPFPPSSKNPYVGRTNKSEYRQLLKKKLTPGMYT